MGADTKAYSRVQESRTAYERVLLMVPGYRGYRGRDLIRGTDQLLRDQVSLRLKQALGSLKDGYKAVVNGGNMDLAADVDSGVRTLDKLNQMVSHAASGYTGRWDPAKIMDSQLDRAVEFDANLLEGAGAIAQGADMFRSAPTRDSMSTLRQQLEAFDRTFTSRKQVMLGLEEIGGGPGVRG
jgi:hypothetical protein